MSRRVVVTGLGTINPLGVGARHTWTRLIAGDSGIVKLEEPEYEMIPCQVAGRVPKGSGVGLWDPSDWLDKSSIKRIPLFAQYAVAAAKQALDDSQLDISGLNVERIGVAIGSSIGGLEAFYDNSVKFSQGGYRKVSPTFIPSLLNNMASGHVSIHTGVKGPNHSVSTACTTGAHAIGDAANMIRLDMADAMIAGSSEAVVHPLAVAGFARARSLATKYNDDPENASRPFDKDRDGFVMGEGAGVLILEEMQHALDRGADIYAEVVGYGMSGDAHHITAPAENGQGAYRCMKSSLKYAGVQAGEVDYINAHATSTALGDAAENSAITSLYNEARSKVGKQVNVSSSKGAIGHLLGAAGSVEALFTVLAVKDGILPPTRNLQTLEDGFKLNYVANKAQDYDINYALTNSFGFGGTNASLVFKKYSM